MLGPCRSHNENSKATAYVVGVLVCVSLMCRRSDCKSSGGRRVLVSRSARSYFGRIRRWHRIGSWRFVACETHTSEFFVDGDRDCEDTVDQGDYVFLEAMIDENHSLGLDDYVGSGPGRFSILPLPQARPAAIEARGSRPPRVLEITLA